MADSRIVETSASHAMSGLYMTPDMWFFAAHMVPDILSDSVQSIIHSKQPLTASYVEWSDHVYETYHDWIIQPCHFGTIGEFMMVVANLRFTKWQIELCVNSMVAVAVSIYRKSNDMPDNGKYLPIIPPELEGIRFARPWNIDRRFFRKMLTIDPWLSYTERLRGQFNRSKSVVTKYDFGILMQINADHIREIDEKKIADVRAIKLKEREKAKELADAHRAIKRAVKLHERVIGLDDLKVFLSFKPMKIKGCRFDYTLTMRENSLIDGTIKRESRMAPAHLDIFSKDGAELGSACLYFFDTSLLDYILHVRLHASHPETELEMLQAMHIMSTTKAFYSDPMLPDLKGIHDPVTGPILLTENIFLHAIDPANQDIQEALHPLLKPIALQAFNEVMHFPAGYKAAMETFSKMAFWDFFDGTKEALRMADLITPEIFA